ncbi:MAG: hypothetical protein U9P90_04030 [Patescibacteria group bacterium]|nr:hypothetical protein [Patescibacteria group bacterium]
MNKIIIFSMLIGIVILAGCTQISFNDSDIVNCNEDYDCLYRQSSNGNSAKVVITEEIQSLSLIEKSEVKVKPTSNQFKVSMKIIDLKEIKKEQPMTKSIVGSISKTCPQIVNNLNKIESKEVICTVNSAEEAKQLAIDGLTEDSIKKYNCAGELIDAITSICVTPDFPNFPPGVKKPAVYLYPTETSEIEVKVYVNGHITEAEPNYLTGWKVTAESNGLIDKEYDYLFYEAQLTNLQLPDEGWIIAFSNLDEWFDETLPKLGLNDKELVQFKEYWMEELTEANYYEVKILEDQFLEENMNLIINPKPDTMIRLNFYFKPHSEKNEMKEPTIKTPQRTGFTVVEWGGLLDN